MAESYREYNCNIIKTFLSVHLLCVLYTSLHTLGKVHMCSYHQDKYGASYFVLQCLMLTMVYHLCLPF